MTRWLLLVSILFSLNLFSMEENSSKSEALPQDFLTAEQKEKLRVSLKNEQQRDESFISILPKDIVNLVIQKLFIGKYGFINLYLFDSDKSMPFFANHYPEQILQALSSLNRLQENLDKAFSVAKNIQFSKLLLIAGANKNYRGFFNLTPLHYAMCQDRPEKTDLLLSLEVDHLSKDDNGQLPLHLAAKNGRLHNIQLFIHKHGYLDEDDNYGQTPFLCAADNGHIEVIRFLKNYCNFPPLLHAVLDEDLQAVKSRISLSKWTWTIGGWNPVHLAALLGNYEIIECVGNFFKRQGSYEFHYLLDAQTYSRRYTPLHCAAMSGNIKVITYFLSNGADLNGISFGHTTPLGCAVASKKIDVVNFLLEQGADANIGYPLGQAVVSGSLEIAQALLASGANVEKASVTSNSSPLFFAVDKNDISMVRLLLRYRATVTKKIVAEARKEAPDLLELLENHK